MKKQLVRASIIGLMIGAGAFGATVVAAQTGLLSQTSVEAVSKALEGPDVPITGEALDQASAAALSFTGEGEVTETEVEDEESYYEVEVTLNDGTEVDVQLDEHFVVVGSEYEDDDEDDDD